jgi:hypothetical protein
VSQHEYTLDDTIYEPSCGPGIIIAALIEHMRNKHNLGPEELYSWFCRCVYASDIDADAIASLRNSLQEFFTALGCAPNPEDIERNICVRDALFSEPQQQYDYIIGNPPYVRTINLGAEYSAKVRAKYDTCGQGSPDLYYAFCEMAHKSSRKGYTFIVPNRFFITQGGRRLREILQPALVSLVDFGTKEIFPGVGVYTCIISSEHNNNRTTYMLRHNTTDDATPLPKSNLTANRWSHEPPPIMPSGIPLGKLAMIHSSITTSCAPAYIILSSVAADLEPDLLIPHHKISKIRALTKELNNPVRYCIYPYSPSGELIPEETMQTQYPRTYAHLLRNKGLLDKRTKEAPGAWYAYASRQQIRRYDTQSTLLLLPQMFRNISEQMMVVPPGHSGYFSISGGIVIEVTDPAAAARIIAVIRTKEFDAYLRYYSELWPGDYYKFFVRYIAAYNIP